MSAYIAILETEMTHIRVLHGPNLNLLGTREPEVYGSDTLGDINQRLEAQAGRAGFDISFLQSNAEHELVGQTRSTILLLIQAHLPTPA